MFDSAKRRFPVLANARPFHLLYGAFLGFIAGEFARAWRGEVAFTREFVVLHVVLLALATLVFAVFARNQYKYGLVPDYSMKCRFCNGPVNRYSEFCEHCGADLIDEEKLIACPKCGAEVIEGTKHCPECGRKLPPARPSA
ncbi:MAG: zinc ribbon domain-containing protein, partial [Thermoplasmatota archaeon]